MKAVVFDFNGTLFLDNDKHVEAWSQMARELRGSPITNQELKENMNGKTNCVIVQYLHGGQLDEELIEKYSQRKEELYRQFCRKDTGNFHLIKGAEQLFDELKARGIPFTIASASIKPNIDFFVESFGLDRWIDPEKIVYDDGSYADKEAMFKEAARILHTPVEEITVFEDSVAGVTAALADGVQDIRIINSGGLRDQVKDIPAVKQVMEDMSETIL